MKIKRVSENKYVALDEHDLKIGSCSVARKELGRIFADEPVQYVIKVSCDDECRDLLYGAAVTRARLIASKEEAPCRLFADLDVNDAPGLEVIKALGFTGSDGINRMTRRVTDERITLPVPVHCTIVRDFLENEEERKNIRSQYAKQLKEADVYMETNYAYKTGIPGVFDAIKSLCLKSQNEGR